MTHDKDTEELMEMFLKLDTYVTSVTDPLTRFVHSVISEVWI